MQIKSETTENAGFPLSLRQIRKLKNFKDSVFMRNDREFEDREIEECAKDEHESDEHESDEHDELQD
jgi:hypothetical protein